VSDSTLGPNTSLAPTGGPNPAVGGLDQVIMSTVPITLDRDNIYGGAIAVMLSDITTGTSLIADSYIHDTWSSAGDHTDLINGNPRASHVTVRHNTLDGVRTGGAYVTNCLGLYDDDGPYTDWTIDNNYVDHCATSLLATTDTARFGDPFVVTNNVFTSHYSVQRFAARAPSAQSGNRDEDGSPLQF